MNECDLGLDTCGGNATCSNTGGSFTCECDDGYVYDAVAGCADDDKCADNPCHTDATCTNEVGTFKCECNSGYAGDGVSCAEVDYCASSPCDLNAACTDEEPPSESGTCVCNAGYAGDGYSCSQPCEEDSCSQPCEEIEGAICHSLGFCAGTQQPVPIPSDSDVVSAGVSWPVGSDGMFRCGCSSGVLGHGYGAEGCSHKGFAVRIVYRGKTELDDSEENNLLALLGNLSCNPGSGTGCDHIHYVTHGSDLGVNVLFPATDPGKSAADAAALNFNNQAPARRRSGTYPAAVDPRLGARVYAWNYGTTATPLPILPAGMVVGSVLFEPACAETGCWVIETTYTTGSSEYKLETFNSFYLPYAVGSDSLSYDYDYANSVLDSFLPSQFPCRVSDYTAANGVVEPLPVRVTACCFGTAFDSGVTDLGGDGSGMGLLGQYRVTETFAEYATAVYPELCPGGPDNPNIDDNAGTATTPKPEDRFPDGVHAGSFQAAHFLAAGQRFVGMPASPGVVTTTVLDGQIGQYAATIKLDEKELRTKSGLLRGTVGVEHSVDFFLGFVTFKAATGSWVLDSLATQTAIHIEKTSFFSVSTHGINDYTFLEYVNMRLVAVYTEDRDFSGADESTNRTVRTSSSAAAHYVQVTFTLGRKYGVNANSGLIPLDSVRAGRGTFFSAAEAAGDVHHKCVEYTATPANEFDSWAAIAEFNKTLNQECGPAAVMCSSPESIPDQFVAFNIPLGVDFFGEPSKELDNHVFVHLVVSATDNDARIGSGSQSKVTSPNEGETPWQMKTTLSASIPVVEGGINIFCDAITAKTDLTDVANVDIIVGSAASLAELSRLRIVSDVASSQLNVQGEIVIDSDSIESGLMTLVLKGDAAYFDTPSLNNRGVSLELEDAMTIHLMESHGATADDSGSEGKQAAVKALLAEAPDDNTDALDGLDRDGYPLNGAFFFTVDRSAQRAHLEPSQRLLDVCPFNPTRPQVTGSVVLETCVLRRDIRYRDYPWRAGAVSTAMEIASNAYETKLDTTSTESGFFTSIFGDSDYAKQLAVDFASAIDEKYSLNGRSRRAFWINPGYEWSPTKTGGASLFQLSQKLFLFALVTLDEKLASSPGKSIFDAPPFEGAPQDIGSTGASKTVPNLPRVPGARRRMLLAVDPTAGERSTLSSAELSFGVTRLSIMASAYRVPADHVATFAVKLQLLPEQECVSREELQLQMQIVLEAYVKQSASAINTVQVLSFSTPLAFGSGCGARRAGQTRLTADVDMLIVFSETARPVFDLSRFSALPLINAVTPVSVSNAVKVHPVSQTLPVSLSDPGLGSNGSSLNIALVAACGGALVFCVGGGAIWYRRFGSRREVVVTETMNFDEIKDRFMDMTGPASVSQRFQNLEEASRPLSPAGARVLAQNGNFQGSRFPVTGEIAFAASQDTTLFAEGKASHADDFM